MYTASEIEKANNDYAKLKEKTKIDMSKKLSAQFSQSVADDITRAMGELVDFVTEGDAMAWLASLYDAERGGFYFSASARDGDEFLPDLESTSQALGLFLSSGASSHLAPTLREALPSWMGEDVVRFVKEKQDGSNGYFYHPQWDKEKTNSSFGRLGRDLTSATRLLGYFGSKPTYDTPTGVSGSGIKCNGEKVNPHIFSCEKNSNAKKARPHFESLDNFKKYLEELEPLLASKSWEIGNKFESEGSEIAAMDESLRSSGLDGGFCDTLADWFTRHQNKATGMWTESDEPNYDGTNGLLKICSTYNRINRPFPHPVEALASAIKCITKEDVPDTVCHVLNPWYAVNVISMNVNRFYSGSAEGDTVLKIRAYIAEYCAEMIRATARKLARFKIGDGSFTYKPNRTGLSQGMRVAPDGVWDGDVNATTICARAIPEHIYEILGFEMPPLYSGGDAMRFVNMLEEKSGNKNFIDISSYAKK